MLRVLLIDIDIENIEKMKNALIRPNEEFEFKTFANLSELDGALKEINLVQKPDRVFEATRDFFRFNLCVFNYNETSYDNWKFRLEAFRVFLPEGTPICFVGYDDIRLKISQFRELGIFNIIYKPFDQLILKETLHLAVNQHKNVLPVEIKPQRAKARVAMLKEINVVSISEMGFLSTSEKEIPEKSTAKYFSPVFSYGRKKSVWAECLASIPVPDKPGLFVSKFQYVGIEPGALRDLRLYIKNNRKDAVSRNPWKLENAKTDREVSFAFVNFNQDLAPALKDKMESYFANLNVELIQSGEKKLKKKTKNYDCVINFSEKAEIESLKKYFSGTRDFILVTRGSLTEDQIQEYALNYKDIFLEPLDRSYLFKKLKLHFPDLQTDEPIDIPTIKYHEGFKSSRLVEISEICELSINLEYERELPLGSVREFVFLMDDENDNVELPAFCNFSQKIYFTSPKKECFLHQFIFWGMTDQYLKQIRLWLRHHHIMTKKI